MKFKNESNVKLKLPHSSLETQVQLDLTFLFHHGFTNCNDVHNFAAILSATHWKSVVCGTLGRNDQRGYVIDKRESGSRC